MSSALSGLPADLRALGFSLLLLGLGPGHFSPFSPGARYFCCGAALCPCGVVSSRPGLHLLDASSISQSCRSRMSPDIARWGDRITLVWTKNWDCPL